MGRKLTLPEDFKDHEWSESVLTNVLTGEYTRGWADTVQIQIDRGIESKRNHIAKSQDRSHSSTAASSSEQPKKKRQLYRRI